MGIFHWLKTGQQLKFTQEIAHETRCRIIGGKFPDPKLKQKRDSGQAPDDEDPEEKKRKREDRRDQDCFIIDSLISHFGGKIAHKNLLFATEDNGFGTFEEDGTGPLDDTFQGGLPPALIFKDLSMLVKFINEKNTVTLPTQEQVEEQKKREIEAAQLSSTATVTMATTTTPYPWLYGGVPYAWNYIAGVWTPMPTDVRLALKTINILRKNETDQYEQVGTICFHLLPVKIPEDYSWSGQAIAFDQVRDISKALIQNVVKGRIGDLEWWED